ncbi:MAG: ABC transporter permease [Gemmatimonadota bacterium]|nr:MAG: ABC transporter permease [Gemmatimonadota bacterium]
MLLLRILVRTLPAEFRREFGHELLETIRNRWKDLRGGLRPVGKVLFWIRQGWAVVRESVELRKGAGLRRAGAERGGWRGANRATNGKRKSGALLEGLWSDVKQSARALAARPGFTVVAVLILSLGIGATTAMFSAVNSVLLRPLPYRDSENVVALYQFDSATGELFSGVSAANIRDLQEASELLSAAGVADPIGHDLVEDGRAVSLKSWAVSEGFLEAIGATPIVGRVFSPDEYQEGAERVVMMSHATWQSRFGADPDIVGNTIVLDNAPHTLVGVLPSEFKFPSAAELWSPRAPKPWDPPSRGAAYMGGAGRLAAGVTLTQAQAEVDRISAGLAEQYPRTNTDVSIRLVPLREHLFGDVKSPLFVLFGAVTLVLLIAAANVAGLQLARGAGRTREYSLRRALGASSGRLLRLVSVDSLLIAGTGCVLGVGLAFGGVELIRMMSPSHLPRIDELAMDRYVLVVAVLAAVLSAVVSGIVPALSASRTDLRVALTDGARGATQGGRTNRLRSQLVVGEIALALVLCIGAGLLIRSYDQLLANELGFDPEGLLAVQVFGYGDDGQPATDFFQTSQEEILSIPGVEAVALTTDLPTANDQSINSIEITVPFTIDDRAVPLPGQEPQVSVASISDHYPEVMGLRVIRGRSFSILDNSESAPVVMINEALARRHFPDQDAIGQRLTIRYGRPVSWEIVGVLEDVRPRGYESEPRIEAYFPLAQFPSGSITFVVKAGVEPAQLTLPVQEAIWTVDPGQSVWASRTVEDLLWDWMKQRSFNSVLLVAFALLSLSLAAIGVYGLMSFTVEQRVSEFGIRRAMGAESGHIFKAVLRQGAVLASFGVALGLAGSVAFSAFLRGLLFGIGPFDPVTFVVLSAVVIASTLLAAFVPAHRATKVHPAVALRVE